jgi:hypothetical protein
MLQRLTALAMATALTSCGSQPQMAQKRGYESTPLQLPCEVEAKKISGVWYVNILRDPAKPEKFAVGSFDARVTIWVTFESGQQLVTLHVSAAEDAARVDSGKVSTGRMITGEHIVDVEPTGKCEAFAPVA